MNPGALRQPAPMSLTQNRMRRADPIETLARDMCLVAGSADIPRRFDEGGAYIKAVRGGDGRGSGVRPVEGLSAEYGIAAVKALQIPAAADVRPVSGLASDSIDRHAASTATVRFSIDPPNRRITLSSVIFYHTIDLMLRRSSHNDQHDSSASHGGRRD
jgi:hypothetical protein